MLEFGRCMFSCVQYISRFVDPLNMNPEAFSSSHPSMGSTGFGELLLVRYSY